jgi:pimeloyl-ACP methyl ester carboxylesterase
MTSAELQRRDYRVTTRDGVGLRARSVATSGHEGPVIVLVHGVAAPLEPTYDLPVDGYSFMVELARRGYRAVAFDHRNFGASDRAPAMSVPPIPNEDGAGLHTLDSSVEDIRAVVADALTRFGVDRLTLFGSSRGAIQVLAYAAGDGAALELAILNNPSSLCYLAGVRAGPLLADRDRERTKTRLKENYLEYTAEFQRTRWKKLFGDHLAVDEALQEAYIEACLRSDEEGNQGNPPRFRVPAEGMPTRTPLLDLARLACPVLVIEAEQVPAEHIASFLADVPRGLARLIHIRDSNHFTLRNERRYELANIIDAAVAAHGWGCARARAL